MSSYTKSTGVHVCTVQLDIRHTCGPFWPSWVFAWVVGCLVWLVVRSCCIWWSRARISNLVGSLLESFVQHRCACWQPFYLWWDDCSLTACGRRRLAYGYYGRLVGLLYGCTERHVAGCISNLCGRAWHSSFIQRWYVHFLMSFFLDNAFLDQFLVFCVALCGLIFWNLFTFRTCLCWTCMCAFTASRYQDVRKWRAFLLEALVGRC